MPDGSLNREYVSRDKIEPVVKELRDLTSAQMRRFFSHCRALETRLKVAREPWAMVLTDFLKIDVAAEDAYRKRPRKIPVVFYDFLKGNAAAVKEERDFTFGFLPHFEALVGFSAGKLKERG
jgi:CRISPR/Cas system CSM-associated protein Csm2 small subunit